MLPIKNETEVRIDIMKWLKKEKQNNGTNPTFREYSKTLGGFKCKVDLNLEGIAPTQDMIEC